ncbi:MAG: hypothetical protein DSY42_04475 [Aquifex sp.]|nr:MAG: hypothetical protein DSY42_04475 [Aquifex sp.]
MFKSFLREIRKIIDNLSKEAKYNAIVLITLCLLAGFLAFLAYTAESPKLRERLLDMLWVLLMPIVAISLVTINFGRD